MPGSFPGKTERPSTNSERKQAKTREKKQNSREREFCRVSYLFLCVVAKLCRGPFPAKLSAQCQTADGQQAKQRTTPTHSTSEGRTEQQSTRVLWSLFSSSVCCCEVLPGSFPGKTERPMPNRASAGITEQQRTRVSWSHCTQHTDKAHSAQQCDAMQSAVQAAPQLTVHCSKQCAVALQHTAHKSQLQCNAMYMIALQCAVVNQLSCCITYDVICIECTDSPAPQTSSLTTYTHAPRTGL